MMGNLLKRAEELASEAQRRKVAEVAERLKELLRDAAVEVEEARVLVRGRGIVKRWLIDPTLRFLSGGFSVDVSAVGQNIAVRTAARKSVLGSAATVLATTADPSAMDTANSIDVQLIDQNQWLTSCDDDALDAGANLAFVGGELVQFGDATALGGGRFRLTRLLRGRAGTEAAVSSHAIDEIFCLIEMASLQSIALPVASIGKRVTAQIVGGDSASLTVSPRAAAIASPLGGTTVDNEARTSIDQILATLREHGLIGV
jgi:hypothetical protein